MLVGALVTGVGGALLLGEILFTVARIVFQLSDEPYTVIIIPSVFLVISGVIGTAILVAAFFVENQKKKIWIISSSIGIPIIVEIVDFTIRGIILVNDLLEIYG